MRKPLPREYQPGTPWQALSPSSNPDRKISCPSVAARLTADHISVLFPDVDTPFRDVEDVVDRLLPYHVFQHPREDLPKAGKGKRKATEEEILQNELAGAPCSSLAGGCCLAHPRCYYFRNKVCTGVL